MRRLVVIGGGIAGLAAAWAARAAAGQVPDGLDVLVLESSGEVGGKARTVIEDGWMVEAGPTGFLGGTPELDRLIAASGLEPEVVAANAVAARRFIHVGGRMRRVAPNPIALVRAGVLSVRGCVRMVAEIGVAARRDGADESVWDFAARRLGREVADRMIAPMALGVFAGDAHRLSLPASFPKMAELEREHGSLIRALLARKGRRSATSRASGLHSFRGGMQALPRALAAQDGIDVRCDAGVRQLIRSTSGWQVAIGGTAEPLPADVVVVATETRTAATLLREHDAALAADLEGISCPPVAVVALGFDPASAARIPQGFGVLIARGEGFRMLGNLWDTHLFHGRSPDGHMLMRAMYGGGVDPEAAELPETDLAALARSEVSRLYGIDAKPIFEHVTRWPHAIPQYELGHSTRVRAIEQRVQALPGLFVTGAGLRGVAFPQAAADGVRTGEAATAWLATGAGRRGA